MPLELAIILALMTGLSPSTDSSEIRPVAARSASRDSATGSGLESRAEAWFAVSSLTPYPDHRTSVAFLAHPRENAEESRETEEKDSEDEDSGRPIPPTGPMLAPWNGPAHHTRSAPDPSNLPAPLHVFLLCGRLSC